MPPATPPRAPARGSLVSLALLVVLVVVATWPLPVRLGDVFPGDTRHPGLQGDIFFQWNLLRQLAEGRWPDHLHTALLRFPEGQAIDLKVGFSLHLGLYALLMLGLGLVPAHNVAVLIILVANGLAMHRLAWVRSRDAGFALAAGAAFALGPYVHLKLDQGFVQKATLFTLPLFVLALLRLVERPRLGAGAAAAGLLLLTAAIYPPYAVYCVVFAGLYVPVAVLARRAGPWRRALPLVVGGAALTLGLLWLVGHGDPQFRERLVGGTEGVVDLFRPWRWLPYPVAPMGAPADLLDRLPLGLPGVVALLALLGAGVRGEARILLGVAAGFLVLMAGPWLSSGGELVRVAGRPVPLPLALVEQSPYGVAFNLPIRMMPLFLVALLLVAGEGVAWLRRRWPGVRPGILSAGLLLALGAEHALRFPEYRAFHLSPVARPAVCDEGPGVLLHLPYQPPWPNAWGYLSALCDAPTANPLMQVRDPMPLPRDDAGDDAWSAFLAQARDGGVTHLLVHPAAYATAVPGVEPTVSRRPGTSAGRRVVRRLEGRCGPPRDYVEDGILAWTLADCDVAAQASVGGQPPDL